MLFYQPVHFQGFAHPTSFPGIYSEDDYVNDMAQRAAHDYALARAHVQALERQRHQHRHYPLNHQSYPDALYRDRFSAASLDALSYSFGPASARPTFNFSPDRRVSANPFEELELAYTIWQEEERQRALNRQREAIVRQRELAREREAQRRRALAEAAAREHQARVAHAARIQARQAHDAQALLSLLGQLGLAVVPAQPASVPPQVLREQPPVLFIRPTVSVAPPAPAQPSLPVDCKGKGRAVAMPVEIPAPVSRTVPAPPKVPTLKEELEARLRSETDPDVQESLALLYSDLFDVREPAQPAAGPSGHKRKRVSFAVPVSSTSTSSSPLPAAAEAKTVAAPTPADNPVTDEPKTEGAQLHRTPALPPAVAAKLMEFYRARRARKLSLAHIKDVEDALRQLEGAFEFPAQLDFVDRSRSPSPSLVHSESTSDADAASLAYTANNTPVHVYEHALNELLTKLDAVESNGDVEIRGRRREVVKEVERALEAMERRIEESRERSRERTKRGSVSSQVSDASVTVTPYNVHSSDNVDEVEVEVTVTAESEVPVEVPAEVEETEAASDVENASVVTEDPALQVEVIEDVPAPTNEDSEATLTLPLMDNFEPKPLTLGIPDSGADVGTAPSSDPSVFSDPTSLVNEEEDLDGALAGGSPSSDASASQLVPPAVETLAVPSRDPETAVTEENVNVSHAGANAQSGTEAVVAVEAELVSEPQSRLEQDEESSIVPPSRQPAGVATLPEAVAHAESTATDATYVTVDNTLSAAEDDLLNQQMSSRSAVDNSDALEIVANVKDELREAKNGSGSDWSDVGSESDL